MTSQQLDKREKHNLVHNEYQQRVASKEHKYCVLQRDTRLEASPQTSHVVSGFVQAHMSTEHAEEDISKVQEPSHMIHRGSEDWDL